MSCRAVSVGHHSCCQALPGKPAHYKCTRHSCFSHSLCPGTRLPCMNCNPYNCDSVCSCCEISCDWLPGCILIRSDVADLPCVTTAVADVGSRERAALSIMPASPVYRSSLSRRIAWAMLRQHAVLSRTRELCLISPAQTSYTARQVYCRPQNL